METQSKVHLVYGPVAAGKSTFAIALAEERTAVRFALDDWMHVLFGADKQTSLTMAWVLERVARCQAMIWSVAKEVLASGREVVLEMGLLRQSDRLRIRAMVEAASHRAAFYYVDADRDLRAERVLQRNVEKGQTFSFEVTPAMFEAMESYMEPPMPDEAHHVRVVAGRASRG